MNLLIPLRQIAAVVDIWRSDRGIFQVLGRIYTAIWLGSAEAPKRKARLRRRIRIGIPSTQRIQQPDANTIAVWGRRVCRVVAFAAIFHIHAEYRFHRHRTGLRSHPRLRNRSCSRVPSLVPARKSCRPDCNYHPHGPDCSRVLGTRQARAQQAVKLTDLAVTRSVQRTHQAVACQVPVMFPRTTDARIARCERESRRKGPRPPYRRGLRKSAAVW